MALAAMGSRALVSTIMTASVSFAMSFGAGMLEVLHVTGELLSAMAFTALRVS